jgi:hypothetical protein
VELTKRQRNEIFDALQAKGVDPSRYELTTSGQTGLGEETFVEIRHVPTNSVFELSEERGFGGPPRHMFRWNVHDGPISGGWHQYDDWAYVLDQIHHWTDEVKYVVGMPDLWEELKRAPEMLAAVQQGEIGSAPFTPAEQAEIGRRLNEVKQLVRENFELTSEQLGTVDQRLDDAEEAAKHSDRKTWLYTFYGAVMSTFMTDEIPPHVIQTIVTTVLHGIGHLFGIGELPPVIGP